MNLNAKMAMSGLQRYPWNLNLIKNVEDTVVFLTRKEFISVRMTFSLLFHKQGMRKSLKQRNHKWKLGLKKQNTNIHYKFIQTWSKKLTRILFKMGHRPSNRVYTMQYRTSFLALSMLSVFPIKLSWPNSSFIVCEPWNNLQEI